MRKASTILSPAPYQAHTLKQLLIQVQTRGQPQMTGVMRLISNPSQTLLLDPSVLPPSTWLTL